MATLIMFVIVFALLGTMVLAALETQPDNAAAQKGIGLAQRKLGNFSAAAHSFRIYFQLMPDAPDRAELEAWVSKHS